MRLTSKNQTREGRKRVYSSLHLLCGDLLVDLTLGDTTHLCFNFSRYTFLMNDDFTIKYFNIKSKYKQMPRN